MSGRQSTPLPRLPYAIAPRNKYFDQVSMQNDNDRPQVSKATGHWADVFGRREWDPVEGVFKMADGSKVPLAGLNRGEFNAMTSDRPTKRPLARPPAHTSPGPGEETGQDGSDRALNAFQSIRTPSLRAENVPSNKRSFGQISPGCNGITSHALKKRNLGDIPPKEDCARAMRPTGGSASVPNAQDQKDRKQSLQSAFAPQQSGAQGLSTAQMRAALYGSAVPTVGSEARAAALRQSREKKEIGQKRQEDANHDSADSSPHTAMGPPPRRSSSITSDDTNKAAKISRPLSPDRGVSLRPTSVGIAVNGASSRGGSLCPFAEDCDSDEDVRPSIETSTSMKLKTAGDSLFVPANEPSVNYQTSTGRPVGPSSNAQKHSGKSSNTHPPRVPITPPKMRPSPGSDTARRSSSLTRLSPKVFRPSRYNAPLGTKIDEMNPATDLQKASQALSNITSEQQDPKARVHGDVNEKGKEKIGGNREMHQNLQKPFKSQVPRQGDMECPTEQRPEKKSGCVDRNIQDSVKVPQAVLATQRPHSNTKNIAAQAESDAENESVPRATATGFGSVKTNEAKRPSEKAGPAQATPTREAEATTKTANRSKTKTDAGPTSLRDHVDKSNNTGIHLTNSNDKSEPKPQGRNRSRSRPPTTSANKLGTILGEDPVGKLISQDDFITLNGEQGWVARRIGQALLRRHGIKITASEVRDRFDELNGTTNGIPLRHHERDNGTSRQRSSSQSRVSEKEDKSFELGLLGTDDEDESISQAGREAKTLPRRLSPLPPFKKPVRKSQSTSDQDDTSSTTSQENKTATKPAKRPAPRPTTGGKTIPDWKVEYYDALTTGDSDEEEAGTDIEAATTTTLRTQHPNRTFYIYTVLHRIYTTDDPDPEDTDPEAIGITYYDLSQANTAAQQAAMGATMDARATLGWDIDANGMFTWTHVNFSSNTTTVTWVEREERLLAPSDAQPDDSVNVIGRTIWAVKDEVSVAAAHEGTPSGAWQIASTSDVGPLYSSLCAANKAAATHLLERHVLATPPRTGNLNVLDAWKGDRRREIDENREWFDAQGSAFEEICELGEGRVVKVWVVQREFVGARN